MGGGEFIVPIPTPVVINQDNYRAIREVIGRADGEKQIQITSLSHFQHPASKSRRSNFRGTG